MVYTIQLDLVIDDDEIYSDETIKDIIEEGMNCISATARDIKVIDIND